MSGPTSITRKLLLAQAGAFAYNVRTALSQAGVADLAHAQVFQSHVTARCCRCDARPSPELISAWLTGAELEAGGPTTELSRLRLAYCLRPGCDSRFYEFSFTPHSSVDWAAIRADAQPDSPPPSVGLAVGGAMLSTAARALREQLTWKLAFIMTLLLALLLWRQWWTGGSIPFFREAKTFTSQGAAPAPVDEDREP